jgi:hypothetical protein
MSYAEKPFRLDLRAALLIFHQPVSMSREGKADVDITL